MALVGNTQLDAGGAEMIPAVLALLKEEGIEWQKNPDVYVHSYQSFGIDEARELRARARSRAFDTRRVFVIATPSMTTEAQNALLKTLEEPAGEALGRSPTGEPLFFFIVPSPQTLLPTLRSRSQILSLESTLKESIIDTGAFLAATSQKRLDMLNPLLEKGDDDKRDLAAILTFLSSLERSLGAHVSGSSEGARALYRARKYITDKGALVKPLLEHVALLVPVVKFGA